WLRFFFFQAEDGIRDFHVTGVQTCALPISRRRARARRGRPRRSPAQGATYDGSRDRPAQAGSARGPPWLLRRGGPRGRRRREGRSEERRVGQVFSTVEGSLVLCKTTIEIQ